jgi:hypothetical protein
MVFSSANKLLAAPLSVEVPSGMKLAETVVLAH